MLATLRLAARVDERATRAEEHLLATLAGHSGTRRIDGVESAVRTSMHIATRNSAGLSEAIGSVRRMLRKNLSDLYEAYAAYLRADDDATNQLVAAGRPLDALDGWTMR
ncbi:MAG: hypothetical protein ACTHMS_01955 [Jatrophihabitans sp.]|uniref:hypothetical protein n=1 Tax=Jatrophihabitans sp. TaxID=1932789 RepID=UPI003F8132B7